MAGFQFYFTNDGQVLQMKAQAGGKLQYTRVGIGSGIPSIPISELTNLVKEQMSCPISDVRVTSSGKAVVSTSFTNQDISEPFTLNEIGVFAMDPDNGEVLYCYGFVTNGEEVPASGGSYVVEKVIDIITSVGNAQNVSALIDESLVYLTRKDAPKIIVSDSEPFRNDTNTYWYEEVGNELQFGEGGGRYLHRRNANFGRLSSDFTDFVPWYGLVEQVTDPNYVITGTSSLKISVDSEENMTSAAQLRFVHFNLSKAKNMLVRFYVPELYNLSKFQIRLSNVAGMSDYLFWEQSRWKMVPGWNEVLIPLSQLTAVGTANATFLEDVQTIQISVTGRDTAYIVFDALYMNHVEEASVMFHFDDGWESQYTNAFPILSQHGYVGNVGVISGYVGSGPYMSLDQLKRLYEYGWDLFNHTNTHKDLTTLDLAGIRDELLLCKKFLESNGLDRAADIAAYPYGSMNANVLRVMEEQNFRLGRTVMEEIEVAPPIQPYVLKSLNIYNNTEDIVYQRAVDHIVATGGTLMILLHRIEGNGTASIVYPTDKFEQMVDYVFNKDDVRVVTISEWASTYRL
ncbi:polysaccharide deacetylase family protein [Xylanibacillus composti]|uniref:NodB homology domain-containing protein n=1 Tax=Xylanibacillus composti TaxID=1572762 RepID=A0A8J4H1K3_9BACL|nr:polysaccharide deacetylase family protein [Xylanibacillus composti]GIQ69257.1 hypothetical protein XYCOK13_20810 [Xylanibacillus composti]